MFAALIVAFASITGSDLYARTSVGRLPLGQAVSEHFYWASVTTVGLLFLVAPFLAVAIISHKALTRSDKFAGGVIFVIGSFVLAYFYFGGFQAAEQAMLDERWTAAALSLAFLPFFVGIPVVAFTGVAAMIVPLLHNRRLRQR